MKRSAIAVLALLAGAAPAAIGLASPAVATDGITQNAVGAYELQYLNNPKPAATWIAAPCEGDLKQCIKITEFGLTDTALKNPHWSANAFWGVGSWIMEPVAGVRTCKDGTKYDVQYNYSWDAATNSGWRSFAEPGICDGNKAGGVSAEFELNKVGPAPTPAAPAGSN